MACVLVKEFADFKMCWVPREMNVEANELASRALGRGLHEECRNKMFDG
jgi:hypothetical protein